MNICMNEYMYVWAHINIQEYRKLYTMAQRNCVEPLEYETYNMLSDGPVPESSKWSHYSVRLYQQEYGKLEQMNYSKWMKCKYLV